MPSIVIKNNVCKIKDENDIGFLWALDKHLSFKVNGAEHTKAYKGWIDKTGKFVRWDGVRKLLTDNLTFPIGLLERVKRFYNDNNKTVNITNKNPKPSKSNKINILPQLTKLKKVPYFYQEEAACKAVNVERGIIRVATGAGKSLIATLITAKLGKSTVIYVVGKDLLHQIYQLFNDVFVDNKIGIIGDGLCEIGDINIASVWTVGKAFGFKTEADGEKEQTVEEEKYELIKNTIINSKVHLIDECHVAACETVQEISKHIRPEHFYGMSASPWRDDGADLLLEAVLGEKIVDISASYLINHGFLVPPIIKFYKVPKIKNAGNQYKTIYSNYIVNNDVRNAMVVDGAKLLIKKGYKTLVLYHTIKHGKILYDLMKDDVRCMLLSGNDDYEIRKEAKRKIEAGEIDCILASKIFDIGVDIPCLSGLVAAGSGKSSVRALQRVGRVIRKFIGKTNAAVIEFNDDAKYLKQHSKARYKIYSTEERFKLIWEKK